MECIHHWHIDLNDVGQCQNCKRVKDFGKFLKRETKLSKKDTPSHVRSELAEASREMTILVEAE